MRLRESMKKRGFFVVAVCIVLLMLCPGCCTQQTSDPLDVIDTGKLMDALYNDAAMKGTGQ